MARRLIEAGTLKECLKFFGGLFSAEQLKALTDLVDKMPTAYDPDEKARQIESMEKDCRDRAKRARNGETYVFARTMKDFAVAYDCAKQIVMWGWTCEGDTDSGQAE